MESGLANALVEAPLNAVQASGGLIGELPECGRREVEVVGIATLALVDNLDRHGPALVFTASQIRGLG